MNINCEKLFVYSYRYPVFLYAYIIASQILNFSATVELMHFELSAVKKNCFQGDFELQDLGFFDLILDEKDVGGEKI